MWLTSYVGAKHEISVKTFVSANVKTLFCMSVRSSVWYIVQKVYADTHTLMLKEWWRRIYTHRCWHNPFGRTRHNCGKWMTAQLTTCMSWNDLETGTTWVGIAGCRGNVPYSRKHSINTFSSEQYLWGRWLIWSCTSFVACKQMQNLPENVAPCHHTASNVLQVSHVLCSHLQIAVNHIMIHFVVQ